MELRARLVLLVLRYGIIHLEPKMNSFISRSGSLLSYLDISCQGEGGSAGENGTPGPMVSNSFSFKCHYNGMQYRNNFVS